MVKNYMCEYVYVWARCRARGREGDRPLCEAGVLEPRPRRLTCFARDRRWVWVYVDQPPAVWWPVCCSGGESRVLDSEQGSTGPSAGVTRAYTQEGGGWRGGWWLRPRRAGVAHRLGAGEDIASPWANSAFHATRLYASA